MSSEQPQNLKPSLGGEANEAISLKTTEVNAGEAEIAGTQKPGPGLPGALLSIYRLHREKTKSGHWIVWSTFLTWVCLALALLLIFSTFCSGSASSAGTGAFDEENIEEPEKNRKIFGFQVFSKNNLTFEPSLNIPLPPDYVAGIGDEIIINVWGACQQTYFLVVGNNEAVNIPDLGLVQVAGLNYSEIKKIILKRLTAIYNGMTGSNPNTYADVSINNSRSIKVNVIGEAMLPGTYTLPATASAFNALYLSGGPNDRGSFRNIRVMRDNKLIAEIDVYDYLINGNTENNIYLRDQDVILIPAYHKCVETMGAFKRNGIFELREGENIEQLLSFTGGFSADASGSRLLLTRLDNDQFKLTDVDKPEFQTIQLQNGDMIRAEKVIDRFENRLVIEGAVFRPGSYALEEGTTLSGLIEKAGGLREDVFSHRGIIIRLDEQLYPTIVPFDVNEVMSGTNDLALKREDQVIIRDIFDIGERKTVRIYGEVMRPAEYDFSKNMTLHDLIFMARGMKEAASESYVEVARRNSYEEAGAVNSKMASLFQFHVNRGLNLSAEDAIFKLQPFDQVYVRKAPSYERQKTVKILGEVRYPGEYSISDKNERVSGLIARAGGLVPTAYPGGARMRRLTDTRLQLQMDVIRRMEMQPDTAIMPDAADTHFSMELRLADILKNADTPYDYLLKEGDEIYVPMRSEGVWVNGEVLNPGGLAWEQKKSIKYYVGNAGGFGDNAHKGSIYVIYSNGAAAATKKFITRSYPKIEPGCQIIVPAKPEKKNKSQSVNTWLTIMGSFASLAIAAAVVFK